MDLSGAISPTVKDYEKYSKDSGYLILNYTDKKIPISKQRKPFTKSMLGLL